MRATRASKASIKTGRRPKVSNVKFWTFRILPKICHNGVYAACSGLSATCKKHKMLNCHLAAAVLIAALVVAHPVAANAPPSEPSPPQDDWRRCQSDSECVMLSGACGVEWAVNKNFADQARRQIEQVFCKQPFEYHPPNTVAKCENNLCVLSPCGSPCGDMGGPPPPTP